MSIHAFTRLTTQVFRQIPLRVVLVVPFVVQVVGAVGIVGYLSLRNGQQAVHEVVDRLQQEISDRIEHNLQAYLSTPHRINQSNATAILRNQLNIRDLSALEEKFWQQFSLFDGIVGITLGNEQREFIGIESRENNLLVVMESSQATNYNLQTHQVNPEGRRIQRLTTTPNYNPRLRPWYQAAVTSGKATWSPIFPQFETQKPTMAAVLPIYNSQKQLLGVSSIGLYLSQVSDFLRTLKIGKTGQTFIVERTGALVATSTAEQPFQRTNDKPERLNAKNSQNPLTQATANFLEAHFGDLHSISGRHNLEFKFRNKRNFVQVKTLQDGKGLDWLIIVTLPEADFMEKIEANTRSTIFLCFLALCFASGIGLLTARGIANPILRLNVASQAIARGELNPNLATTNINELRILGQSFQQMAAQLRASFTSLEKTNEFLEERVQERTAALRLSEEKFASAFRSSPDPISLSTFKDGLFIEVNDSFLNLMGMQAEEVIGRNSIDMKMWANPESRTQLLQELQAKGAVRRQEFDIRTKLGEIRTILLSAERIEIGGEAYILAILHDITDRKQTELALRRSELKFRHIFENSQAGIFRTRLEDGLILDANQRFIEIIRSQSLSSTIGHWFATDLYLNLDDRRLLLDRLQQDGKVENYEMQFRRQDGTKGWVLLSVGLNLEESCIEGVITDISDRKRLEEELRQSQQFLDSIIENVPLAVFVKDVHHEFRNVLWNKACEHIFGLERQQALGANVHDFCPPEQADFFLAVDRETVSKKQLIEIDEEPIDTPDRGTIFLRTLKLPLMNGQGEVTHLLCISEDITERKKARVALEKSLALQRTILESISDGILAVDHSGKIISFNQKFIEMWGINPEVLAMPEQKDRILFLANQVVDSEEFLANVRQLYSQPEAESYEVLSLKDGRVFERFSRPQKVGETIIGRVWGFRDITARIQAEAALRESESKFRSIVENASDIIYIQTADGLFSYISPNLTHITGYEVWEVEGHSFTDFIHPDDRLIYKMALESAIETGQKQVGIEVRGQHRDTSWRWFVANLAVLKDDRNRVQIIGVTRDITARKRAEEQLKLEQQKSEQLLLNILPEPIAKQLKQHQGSLAEHFDEVTILFADIVGFTPLSTRMLPLELVDCLNQIFSQFDRLTELYSLEKIKTIGDAYMVVGGLPNPQPDHAVAIADMALAMQRAIADFKTEEGEGFQIRVGINTGAVVAGVIGIKKFIYDLWGDAVNVASRMESSGIPGKIQVTEATYNRLKERYLFEKRGAIEIKGKGEMTTYWLIGKKEEIAVI